MDLLLKGGKVYRSGSFVEEDIAVSDGVIVDVDSFPSGENSCIMVDCSDKIITPGLADVHVHFREPGFSYKETIYTGTMAAARGGYTAVCTMPNLDPAPVDKKTLDVQLDLIKKDGRVRVIPFGAITSDQSGRGVLSAMDEMAPYVIGFSDDGKGVQGGSLMEEAMLKAKSLGKVISAHCEDESLLNGGYIHDGEYAAKNGHKGICSESEWKQVERDIQLAKKTGCAYHVCHVSTGESVELIRAAKKDGVDITCETAPHYLILCDEDLQEDGRFKMNPPLRSRKDRQALIEGIQDGTVDMIATDHAPHSAEEKSKGLAKSAFGVVGLETAFPMLYRYLVSEGIISPEELIELMAVRPRKRFGITGAAIEAGKPADLAVFDTGLRQTVRPSEFCTKGRSTPFEGMQSQGRCVLTVCEGNIVWNTLSF
ncbi:MAG: dihydroorotase [Firmicutes bacterium]|nr:dihydroorotase [Bacillota bacterium]